MIKVITFDLWNTLFVNKSYFDERFMFFSYFLEKKKITISSNVIKNAFDLSFYLPERNYEKNSHIYTEDRISKMLNILKINLVKEEEKEIRDRFEEEMLCDPPLLKTGVKNTLQELCSDYKIGLISNTGITPGRVISKVFQKYDIARFFQVKIFSDEIGFYKPHPILFKTVLDRFDCTPQSIVHVGDKLETDIKGAKDCGIFAIWFNEFHSPQSDNFNPDYEIHKISEVPNIIKSLHNF